MRLPSSFRRLPSCLASVIVATASVPAGEALARHAAREDSALIGPVLPEGPGGELAISIRRFELPEPFLASDEVLRTLSARTGVAGTDLIGVRMHLTMPDAIVFERMEARVADGLFLERDASVLRSIGRFLLGVARLLLFGRLLSVADELEVSSGAWALLLGVGQPEDQAVSLQTKSEVRLDPDDERLTDHGDFLVCRLVIAANAFSELVDVRVHGRERGTGRPVRYHFPRLVLPGGSSGEVVEQEAWMVTELLVRDAGNRRR